MKTKDPKLEANQNMVSREVFMREYNNSIPESFPSASLYTLKRFQQTYPLLFKGSEEWSIDRHRKKYMDWLSAHQKSI